jgi:D-glycero-D-manno-heptose 1,7-bisphosphate phosphatase
MSERVVILDRDGVINQDSDDYIKSADEWIPIPGSLEAIARLNHAGFRVGIVSNQSGIARGLFDLSALAAMHRKFRELLAAHGGRVEMIAYCPHGPDAGCECRKPRPGLLKVLAERLGIKLAGVPLVGDSTGDLEAARAMGMTPWLVRTGKGCATLEHGSPDLDGVRVFTDLRAVADELVKTGCLP